MSKRKTAQIDEPKGRDIRELGAYSIPEAARYLDMPRATLRSWVCGRSYPTAQDERFFNPVIDLADRKQRLLSFVNLVEAHVLNAVRRKHRVSLPKVRAASRFMEREFQSEHPLAQHRFQTDGVDLFVQRYGALVAVSAEGQMAMKEVLQDYLRRVEHDEAGLPIRLYPFVRSDRSGARERVVIDPRVSFGRPVIAGTGIPTSIVAERHKAGESVDELAEDYGVSRADIEECLRCELRAA